MSDLLLPTGLSVSQFIGLRPGPKLIVLGAVYGNETCGTEAIQRTRQEIERGVLRIESGTLTMLPIANPPAHQFERWNGDRNLNRNMRITDSLQAKSEGVISPQVRDQDHTIVTCLRQSSTRQSVCALEGDRSQSFDNRIHADVTHRTQVI